MAGAHHQWSLAVTSIYYHGRKKQKELTEVLDDEDGLPFKPWAFKKCVDVLSTETKQEVLGAVRMAIADIVRNRAHFDDDPQHVEESLKRLVGNYCNLLGKNYQAAEALLAIRHDLDPNAAYFEALQIMYRVEHPAEAGVPLPFMNYKATRHA